MNAPFRSQDRSRRGLTLIELIVMSSILIMMVSSILMFVSNMSNAWDLSVHRSDLRVRAEIAVDEMARELRQATRLFPGSPPNISIGDGSITFYLPADLDGNGLIIDTATGQLEWSPDPVQYSYVSSAKQLQRSSGGAMRVLANDVTSVTFQDNAIDNTLLTDEVRMTLTLQKTTPRGRVVTTTFSDIVKLRNRPAS